MITFSYHLFGSLSTFFFFTSLLGIAAQIGVILKRKRYKAKDGRKARGYATDVLSLNQFFVAFLAYYSFFLYGIAIEPFNHYLVWPRLFAIALTIWILFEMLIDRREKRTVVAVLTSSGLTLLGLAALIENWSLPFDEGLFAQILTVVVTILLGQAYLHQIMVIRSRGETGAVSKTMHQLTLLKDIFTVLFGFTMGLVAGWPLILLSGVSGATKCAILWHFSWVKTGAAERVRAARSLT